MKNKIITFFTLFILTGCLDGGANREIIDVSSSNIKELNISKEMDVEQMFMSSNMYIVGNYIVVFSLDLSSSNKAFYLYNKENLKFVGSFISIGKAKGEIYDLNPNFFYHTSDTTFIANTNIFNETEYVVSNDVIKPIKTRKIVEIPTSNIYKIDKDNYVMSPIKILEDKKEYELILQKKNENGEYVEGNKTKYPNYYNGQCDKRFLYNKFIVSTNKNIFLFYSYVPLIRKYDSDLNILKEYMLKGFEKYKIDNPQEIKRYFFTAVQHYKKNILVKIDDSFLILDDHCNVINRLYLNLKKTYSICCFDDNHIYILQMNDNGNKFFKFKYD